MTTNNRFIQLCHLSALLWGVLFLAACATQSKSEQEDKPLLMVTIEPVRFMADQIGGDYFRIESQIPKGANPETYDMTPRQMVHLSESAAYLRIGYIGFENAWMERLMESNPKMKVFDLSEGLDLINGTNAIEPHIWNSTVNARIIARNILQAMIDLDTEHEAAFQAGYESLLNTVDETEQALEKMLKDQKGKSFLIYHPTLTYFARDWGLHQICIEEDGKEPTIQQLRQITNESRAQGVKTIFIQPEFDHENAKLVAKETGSELSEIFPLSYDWAQELLRIGEILSK